MILFKNGKRMK